MGVKGRAHTFVIVVVVEVVETARRTDGSLCVLPGVVNQRGIGGLEVWDGTVVGGGHLLSDRGVRQHVTWGVGWRGVKEGGYSIVVMHVVLGGGINVV